MKEKCLPVGRHDGAIDYESTHATSVVSDCAQRSAHVMSCLSTE